MSGHDPAQRRAGGKLGEISQLSGLLGSDTAPDGIWPEGGKEHHEAYRRDAEREEAQNFLHLGSYAFSSSRSGRIR
jgi:hypothetical protein